MPPIPDFHWLTSEEAKPFLEECRDALDERKSILRLAKKLRRNISPTQAALVMELSNLRIRARKKFSQADQMFFTQRSLEQSTGEDIANYKARRFSDCESVADICCGIGGDALSLAGQTSVTGIDRNEIVVLFANENLKLAGKSDSKVSESKALNQDFDDTDLEAFDGVHLDPDRRTRGRNVLGQSFQPPLRDVLDRLSPTTKAAIKVAPATPWDEAIPDDAELEWIGDRRECKQQVVWLGGAQNAPGTRVATVIHHGQSTSFVTTPEESKTPQQITLDLGKYIFEPHPSILAAGLVDAFCTRHGLKRLFQNVVYLTSNQPLNTPLVSQFEIVQLLPMDPKATAFALNKLDAGQVEYKKRWITNVVYRKFQRIKTEGTKPFTVLLSPLTGGGVAIIAKRIPFEEQQEPGVPTS